MIEESSAHGTIVVKIGGSTLGDHDTTLEDLVTLQRQGINPVVVHGGGKVITDWMVKQGIRPRFVRGLRVTDPQSLDIVVAVLTGLINKGLVVSISSLGGKAMGISGVDGGMLQAEIQEPELGLVGRVVGVNREPIDALLKAQYIPVIAPVSVNLSESSAKGATLLNVNADTAAGEIAAALGADRIVFLTDVEGVLDSSRRLIPRLTARQARGLMRSNVVAGGMVPKLEACLTALEQKSVAQILDGRKSHALLDSLSGKTMGTRVG
ncbi:MAG: acetylglutamate kinase [Chloroflexi bacterium]|nr:acetylglutamate kinase [Chloroflexota bacterium]